MVYSADQARYIASSPSRSESSSLLCANMGSESSARVVATVNSSDLECNALAAALRRLSSTRVHNALCAVRRDLCIEMKR